MNDNSSLFKNALQDADPCVYELIVEEGKRQSDTLHLIASENITYLAVMQVQASLLTNKYVEGYPGFRYYAGCGVVDKIESLAISRACELFSCSYANVQPHSGSQANMAVYLAALQPGDTILSLSLEDGGHLTHGSKVNFSGKMYRAVFYPLDPKTNLIDYDQLEDIAKKEKPKLIIAGASSYTRTVHFDKFKMVADSCGALLLADIAHISGLVAAGVHPSPVSVADFVSTSTHKTLRGPRGGLVLTNNAEMSKKINSAVFPGVQGGALTQIIAAKAVGFGLANTQEFKEYQRRVLINAKSLANALVNEGFTLVTGGTDNHMVLIDLRTYGLSGKALNDALEAVGLIANKNMIPADPNPPTIASGVRMGSPSVTARGMGPNEMAQIACWTKQVAGSINSSGIAKKEVVSRVRAEVIELARNFPLFSSH